MIVGAAVAVALLAWATAACKRRFTSLPTNAGGGSKMVPAVLEMKQLPTRNQRLTGPESSKVVAASKVDVDSTSGIDLRIVASSTLNAGLPKPTPSSTSMVAAEGTLRLVRRPTFASADGDGLHHLASTAAPRALLRAGSIVAVGARISRAVPATPTAAIGLVPGAGPRAHVDTAFDGDNH